MISSTASSSVLLPTMGPTSLHFSNALRTVYTISAFVATMVEAGGRCVRHSRGATFRA